MSKKLQYTISGISCLTLSLIGLVLCNKIKIQEKPLVKKIVIHAETIDRVTDKNQIMAVIKMAAKKNKLLQNTKAKTARNRVPHPHTPKEIILRHHNLALTRVSFDELPGWNTADLQKSLLAFRTSCDTLLKQSPSHPIRTQHLKLKAQDWHPACKAALKLESVSEESAKAFFEKWFNPLEFGQKKPVRSVFTGYYMPQIKGNLTRDKHYTIPIYGLPKNGHLRYTREQIDHGALREKAPVIAWIHSPAERLFLETEGSGVIQLPNGENLYVGYAGENGSPYTSIATLMIRDGIMTRHNASKKAILRYLNSHPDRAKKIINRNKSFVFFENLKKPMALGAQGTALTPGYSLAVDKRWIPLGAPLWLDTKRPDLKQTSDKQLQRLVIAQDTGGAIRGFMRGDIYWGSGKLATFLGEHMKNTGHYWLLLPKQILHRLARKRIS